MCKDAWQKRRPERAQSECKGDVFLFEEATAKFSVPTLP